MSREHTGHSAASPFRRPAVLVLAPLQGALAFGAGTTLITRVFQPAPDAGAMAGSLATAAFNGAAGALAPESVLRG